MTARDKYRELTAMALTDLRNCTPKWPVMPPATDEIARSLLSELLALRLEQAYAPIFATLGRIEGQIAILANSGRDRWAPPPVIPRMPFHVPSEMPEFLRD